MTEAGRRLHYGVHYQINVKRKKLIKAVPFPDKVYSGSRSQRSHRRGKTVRMPPACCSGLSQQDGALKTKTIENSVHLLRPSRNAFRAARTMVPIDGVTKLEEQAKKAGKSKMEFHYFENLDHSLNVGDYFVKGTLPAGHKAIFEFIRQQTAKK